VAEITRGKQKGEGKSRARHGRQGAQVALGRSGEGIEGTGGGIGRGEVEECGDRQRGERVREALERHRGVSDPVKMAAVFLNVDGWPVR